MTFCFGFYGTKNRGGGVLLPEFCTKISETLKFGLFWGIFACSGLVLRNGAAHQCTYFISYPAFKCLQYHPMPQTCVWTVIGDQNPTYEPYGYGAQKVQKRAKNTSALQRSSHSYARSIRVYVVLIIQMHTIPTQAPNMCVDGDR